MVNIGYFYDLSGEKPDLLVGVARVFPASESVKKPVHNIPTPDS
jgi:hypothetical protein